MNAGERLDALTAEGGIQVCGNAQNCVKVCPKEHSADHGHRPRRPGRHLAYHQEVVRPLAGRAGFGTFAPLLTVR